MSEQLYHPAQEVVEHIKNVRLVLLVGPSGVGKNTLINELIERYDEYHYVMADMSRPPRPEEQDGRDAHFRTREEMERKIAAGAYVQVPPSAFGDYYATSPEAYEASRICLMPCIADEVATMRSLPFKELIVVCLLPPTYEDWWQRMGAHHFTPDKLERRMREARRSLEFEAEDQNCQYILAETIEGAADVLHAVAHGGPGYDSQQARQLARNLLTELQARHPTNQ